MKYCALFVSLVMFSVLASVPHPPAVYVEGSADVTNGTTGSLNLSDVREFQFDYADDSFRLPYDRIISMELDSKPGTKTHLGSSVSWVPKVGKKQAKLLTILYKGENDTERAVVFEIRKEEFESIASTLEARTGKRVSYEREENGKPLTPAPSPDSGLVAVTFTSTPRGAMVLLFGQAAGRTPLTTKLGPGTYTVQMTSSGLPAWTREIEVEPGKPLTVSADLGHVQPDAVVVTQLP
jgi:PEGA domain